MQLSYWVARVLRAIATRLDPPFERRISVARQRAWIKKVMDAHDMVKHPDEPYYGEQYLSWILPDLAELWPERNVRVLDLGCGHGRLSVPIARWNTSGRVLGIETVPSVMVSARKYAREQGVANLDFRETDALEHLRSSTAESVDVILIIETTFLSESYREILVEAARVLAPGGRLWLSVWSQYTRLLECVVRRDWDTANMVSTVREGHLYGGPLFHNWQTRDEVAEWLETLGFAEVRCRGIGICSGIEGDPLSCIAQPSRLNGSDRRELMSVERNMSEQYADNGRYILAGCRKPGALS